MERAGEDGEKRGREKRLERGGGKRRLETGVEASGRCTRVRASSRSARSSHVGRTRAPAVSVGLATKMGIYWASQPESHRATAAAHQISIVIFVTYHHQEHTQNNKEYHNRSS